jgi:hypothetical protein
MHRSMSVYTMRSEEVLYTLHYVVYTDTANEVYVICLDAPDSQLIHFASAEWAEAYLLDQGQVIDVTSVEL